MVVTPTHSPSFRTIGVMPQTIWGQYAALRMAISTLNNFRVFGFVFALALSSVDVRYRT
jgi:hypothetical protein